MTDYISRMFTGDLEIRAAAEGRTIAGIVVPYNREARVSDGGPSYPEMFVMGAFKRTIQHRGDRVKLLTQHDARANPLGRATLLREDPAGLYGEFVLSRTQAADEALELVRDGALDSFSVGFAPIKHEKRGATVVRTEVAIREASLVTMPAYEDARVLAVRAALEGDPEALNELRADPAALEALRALLTELPATTPDEATEQAARNDEDSQAEQAQHARRLIPSKRTREVLAALHTF